MKNKAVWTVTNAYLNISLVQVNSAEKIKAFDDV